MNEILLKRIKKISISILSLLIFISFWYILSIIPYFAVIPSPFVVFEEFIFLWFTGFFDVLLWEHVIASFFRVMIGFFYSFIIAVPIGLIAGYRKILSDLLTPVIELLRPIPPIAWIPFSIMIFGISTMSHTFVIFTGAFFPLFQNTFDAVKNSKRVHRDVALSLGASRSQIISTVLLPSIVPNILTGSRTSLGIAWMCVIAAEMIGIPSNQGIGMFILDMQSIGRYNSMIAGMSVIGIVGLIIGLGLQKLEVSILKWRE